MESEREEWEERDAGTEGGFLKRRNGVRERRIETDKDQWKERKINGRIEGGMGKEKK